MPLPLLPASLKKLILSNDAIPDKDLEKLARLSNLEEVRFTYAPKIQDESPLIKK